MNWMSASGRVSLIELCRKTSAKVVSLQWATTLRISRVTIPERASGNMIERKVRSGEAPSRDAASSSSRGSEAKKLVRKNTANGSEVPT